VSCLSLQGETIISGSWDSTVRLWRVDELQARQIGTLPTEAGNAIFALDRFEGLIATGSHDKRFELFDVESRSLIHRYNGAHSGKTYAIHFQSQNIVATGGCDGKFLL
jgi:WD40 repeat protein